jgi:hypothetical protein
MIVCLGVVTDVECVVVVRPSGLRRHRHGAPEAEYQQQRRQVFSIVSTDMYTSRGEVSAIGGGGVSDSNTGARSSFAPAIGASTNLLNPNSSNSATSTAGATGSSKL